MSFPAVNWAFGQRAPSSAAKFLLVVLADAASLGDWRSWPSVAHLVLTTQQDRKTVLKNLRALEEVGLIADVGKMGKTKQVTMWQLPVEVAKPPRKRPKSGPVQDPETVPNFPANSTVFPAKESQKRDTEPVREPGKEPGEARAARSAPSARGSRLPLDWTPNDADLAFCRATRSDLDPETLAASFRDYWTAKAGKDASKLDWSGTWRNWVRRERAPTATGAAHASRLPVLAADEVFTGAEA